MATRSSKPAAPPAPSNESIALELTKAALAGGGLPAAPEGTSLAEKARNDAAYAVRVYAEAIKRLEARARAAEQKPAA